MQQTFGIRGTALAWFQSYLKNRQHYVSSAGVKSVSKSVSYGVPQGSVLGPLLFSVYTAPVANLITSYGLRHQQYADDTQIYTAINPANRTQVLSNLQECLSALRTWYAHNNLVINPDKSESSLFATKQRLVQLKSLGLTSVSVAGHTVPISDKIKTLGVTLDSTLTLTQQVKSVVQTSFFHIRAIKHIRHLLSESDAKQLTTSLVQSKLDYCNALLYNTSSQNILDLQRIQNTLARITLNTPLHSRHTNSTLATLHWLPVKQRIDHKMACITHTVMNEKQPSYLLHRIHNYEPGRSLRSSTAGLLAAPRTRLHTSDKSFTVAAPAVWKSLPKELRNTQSHDSFRRGLKTHLFRVAYP